ncbi:MAG: DUF4369 domain-containing protein [Bacteroidales bacterium]|nr:DUF4369 domain-containing protein [Bacteroidales bacterium]
MKRTILLLSVLALLFVGCKKSTFTISGTIEGGAGKTIWLEEITPDDTMFIDSIKLDKKGHFKYKYKMPYRSFYNLHTTDDNYIVTLPDYGEHLKVDGKWENLSVTYNIKGSPESMLLWQLQQFSNDGAKVLNTLVDTTNYYAQLYFDKKIDEQVVLNKKDETDSIYRETFQEQQDYIFRFLEENQGSLTTLIALYKPFNNRLLIDTRDPGCIEWYDLVLEGLQGTCPDNPHTLSFKNTTEHLRSALARTNQ